MFGFVRTCQTVFQSSCTILYFYQQWMRFPVAPHPPPPQHLVLSLFWIFTVLIECNISLCCFYLQFLNDMCCWISFHMFICQLYIFQVRCLFLSLPILLIGLLVFLLLSFRSSFYILDTSPLSDMSFANVSSKFVACLLILLMSSFSEQKF